MTQVNVDRASTPNVRTHLVTKPEPDLRWMPTTQEEMAVVAHVREWTHLHTVCALCREQHEHDLDRQTLQSIIAGRS